MQNTINWKSETAIHHNFTATSNIDSDTTIQVYEKRKEKGKKMDRIFCLLDTVDPGTLALLCWRFPLAKKGKKNGKKKTSFGLKTNGVLTFYYMMEWPPKRHTAILLCSKGLEEAIRHSVLHTRSSKRQKYKRNINGNSNNNNNNNKTNKT